MPSLREKIKFIFRPGRKGIGQTFGDLEQEIMDVLWRMGSATVKRVHEELSREKEIAYTTVITVMNRLVEKNLLTKEKEGKIYRYAPTLTEEEYKRVVSQKVVEGLLELDGKTAIAAFIEKVAEDPEDLELLEKLIEQKKGKSED